MIVMKFGGTSVGDAARVHQVATIVEASPVRGLRLSSASTGVTNMLLDAAVLPPSTAANWPAKLTAEIRSRHHEIAAAIGADHERAVRRRRSTKSMPPSTTPCRTLTAPGSSARATPTALSPPARRP
jgi:aspartate kinase